MMVKEFGGLWLRLLILVFVRPVRSVHLPAAVLRLLWANGRA